MHELPSLSDLPRPDPPPPDDASAWIGSTTEFLSAPWGAAVWPWVVVALLALLDLILVVKL